MPLLVLCGQPCSGKTVIADKLATKLSNLGNEVQIVNEEAVGLERNAAYKGIFLLRNSDLGRPSDIMIS